MNHTKLFFSLLAALTLCACGNSQQERQTLNQQQRKALAKADSAALKIATTPTMDCLPLFVAADDSAFQHAGVDVHLRERKAQMDGDTLVAKGCVEGVVSDLVRTERLQREGTPLEYATATGAAWQLVANRTARVKTAGQLAGKMIAMTRFSATDLLTDLVLGEAKPKQEVFRIQINDVQTRLRMLLNNEMDAMWLPEPQATAARQHGHTVLPDKHSKELRLGVIAFSAKALQKDGRRQQVETFLKVYNQTCDSINKYGVRHYANVIKKHMGTDDKTIAALPDTKYQHAGAPRKQDIERAK